MYLKYCCIVSAGEQRDITYGDPMKQCWYSRFSHDRGLFQNLHSQFNAFIYCKKTSKTLPAHYISQRIFLYHRSRFKLEAPCLAFWESLQGTWHDSIYTIYCSTIVYITIIYWHLYIFLFSYLCIILYLRIKSFL